MFVMYVLHVTGAHAVRQLFNNACACTHHICTDVRMRNNMYNCYSASYIYKAF
jgi:hypothetical protein